jgi:hypothetical protein
MDIPCMLEGHTILFCAVSIYVYVCMDQLIIKTPSLFSLLPWIRIQDSGLPSSAETRTPRTPESTQSVVFAIPLL